MSAIDSRVFYVGLRYGHHASHSGYEAFGRYGGTAIRPAVGFRWTHGRWGWPLNQCIARTTGHAWYSLGAHLTEWSTLRHMTRHSGRLYHVLYGDSDLWLLRRANALTRNRLVATFHQPTEQLRQLGIVERIAKRLDGVFLVADAQRDFFQSFLPSERIHVIPHGVDADFFRPAAEPSNEPVVVTLGSHLRDFATLGEAMALVWQTRPEVRFVGVGTSTTKAPDLRGIRDERLKLLERIDDETLLATLHGATAAVFSFADATANNATLEAMASGLPIVATDVGGIKEYIAPDGGILCPPRDPRALADGILRLLEDPALRRRLGTQSRARAEGFHFRIVAERMGRAYSEILDQ